VARNTTYSSDPAASDFPSQSAPVAPASPFRRASSDRASSERASHAAAHRSSAPRHNAEILDFERLSSRRNGHPAAQVGARSAGSRPSAHAATRSARPAASRFAADRNEGTSASREGRESREVREAREGRRHPASHAAGAHEEDAPTFFGELKRSLRHRKADREFESHVPASAQENAAEHASTPRAGVYKGEMGRTQRKSARMQAEATSNGKKKRFALPFHISLGSFRNSRPARISALVCACLILACAFVYPSAKDAYTAIRNQDQAQAEYQAILSRNDEIQNRINLLKTDEGMEDLARSEYGYVYANENAVKVIGLGSQSIAADAENQTAAIASGSVPAPDTWYSPFLDKFFGYDNGTSSSSS
jgi:cell division protein FtsB